MSQQILLAIKAQDREIKRLTGEVNRLKGSIGGIGPIAKVAAGALGAIGLVSLAKNAVNTAARFQDLQTTLASVTGSTKAGAEAFEFIKELSTSTQFGIEDLSKAFIKLKAAGIEPNVELLTVFTDTAAITTDQVGSLEAVTDLFARTVQGGLGLEEIERLGDRGVPVLDILNEKLDLTRGEISEFGKSAEGAKKLVDAFAEGIQERFGGATQKLLGNLSVQFSNLNIAIDNASSAFGMSLAPALGESVVGLTEFIVRNEKLIASIGEGLGTAIQFTVANIDLLASALVGLGLAGIIVLFGKLALAIKGAALQMNIFNKVAGKNPFVRLATGLLAVGSAVATYVTLNKDAEETQDDVNDAVDEGTKSYKNYEDGIIRAAKAQKKAEEQAKKNAKAQKDLAKAHRKTFDEIMKLNETELQKLARQQNEKMKEIKDMLRNRSVSEEEAAKARLEIEKFYGGKARDIRNREAQEALEKQLEASRKIEEDRKEKLELFKQGKFKQGSIERATQEEMLDIVIATGSRTLDILATQNKKFFQLQKAVKIASAIQNTYEGATKAFAQGGFLGFVTSALVIAAGLAQVAQIRAQTYPGRRRGGPVMANSPFIVGEEGAELFVPQSSGTVIPNDRMGTGAVTVNFNISAVDSSDFDDLLMSRQDLIVSVINRALRERGRAAITA
tara:strand:+ start:6266 stop:8290 length:2025 start_codon:yes stop_codon:yes gene_type:complete